MIKGTGVSKGIGIAKAFLLNRKELSFEKTSTLDALTETERFKNAVKKFVVNTEVLKETLLQKASASEAAILDAHMLMVEDAEIISGIQGVIHWDGRTAEFAVEQIFNSFTAVFEGLEDETMSQRAQDLKDIKMRLLEILTGCDENPIDLINEPCILIAKDLTPSDTSRIKKEFVKAIIAETGGYTSHSAIMSRAIGIPAVLGVENIMTQVQDGEMLIVDGETGEIIENPTADQILKYEKILAELLENQKSLGIFKGRKTTTKDGSHFEIFANIGGLGELESVLDNSAEGIGLFRTEFLFMDRDNMPCEEEQFESYKKVALALGEKPVIIRTMDIGGDKEIPFLELDKEENPFLGFRGIRLCLGKIDIFKIQLRALLRASAFGNIKIMLPMVSCVEEIRQTRVLIDEIVAELGNQNIECNKDIELGIMIETPATAVMADVFAKEAAFISIGTNDLTQYTLAVDRGNDKIAYLYKTYAPSVLRLIANIVSESKKANIPVGMCGEAAGDPLMVPFLVAMGLDELSMSASSVLATRKQISTLDKKYLEKNLLPIVLNSTTSEEAKRNLSSFLI